MPQQAPLIAGVALGGILAAAIASGTAKKKPPDPVEITPWRISPAQAGSGVRGFSTVSSDFQQPDALAAALLA